MSDVVTLATDTHPYFPFLVVIVFLLRERSAISKLQTSEVQSPKTPTVRHICDRILLNNLIQILLKPVS